jgi:TonB family protein
MTIATLLALAISVKGYTVQDPKRSSKETDHPKSEVDLMLEDANKRGEHVYGTCIEPCKEDQDKTPDGVERGRALQLPQPAYPAIAAAAHVSGQVQVQVVIDEEGNVIAASAVSGHPLLQATSVAAARNAKFTPAKLNGTPVKVTGIITYNFVSN